MRYEGAPIDDLKKQVISETLEEHDVDAEVYIYGGSVSTTLRGKLLGKSHGPAFVSWFPYLKDIFLKKQFVDSISEEAVEYVLLHEIGHLKYRDMPEEEFCERFAYKYMRGEKDHIGEAWSTIFFSKKSGGKDFNDVELGSDIL